MDNKKQAKSTDTDLIELFNRHPELRDRVRNIFEIAEAEGELKSADEIEEKLVEELRSLGNETMRDWAQKAHQRIAVEIKSKNEGHYCGKKND